jgi:hypothetical protein
MMGGGIWLVGISGVPQVKPEGIACVRQPQKTNAHSSSRSDDVRYQKLNERPTVIV